MRRVSGIPDGRGATRAEMMMTSLGGKLGKRDWFLVALGA
jgi:hypothetical protein